ncbi:CD3324 family protein [Alkalihalobacillus hemicellulosilyticus]|uniref:Mor transcription activator domain-containing protein n=1 Tax=Halalkalibacter hemicellulosilyticusJCM 9152 TaxID=1236971 RepID=W4QKQ4_9BACI|nr:CD3324 family protein [Halalkalibacter hemicellulosilyticus]GAE32676.1 hypothetical protein JCM9152_4222 [Halalkalibacter hemicellulosilyticusJCM 9152]
MSYKKAKDILPSELLELIQEYVDGEYIYIPRSEDNKKSWGSNTSTRRELNIRNSNIYTDYLSGIDINTLSVKYYLSSKSIQRIILKEKKIKNSI